MISLTEDKRMLGYRSLGVYPDIFHFVTTRFGGCSEGTYATFNCSPFAGDEADHVCRNQERLFEAMPQRPRELIIPHQTHGVKSLVVNEAFLSLSGEEKMESLEGIDTVMTCEPGCCICISTADCVPVLLFDTQHRAVAAVHAGWRGTVDYIVGHALERMYAVYGTEGKDVSVQVSLWKPSKWEMKWLRLSGGMALICRESPDAIRKQGNNISIYGRQIVCNYSISESLLPK